MIEISRKKCHRLFPSRKGKSRRGSSRSETRKITRISGFLKSNPDFTRAFARFGTGRRFGWLGGWTENSGLVPPEEIPNSRGGFARRKRGSGSDACFETDGSLFQCAFQIWQNRTKWAESSSLFAQSGPFHQDERFFHLRNPKSPEKSAIGFPFLCWEKRTRICLVRTYSYGRFETHLLYVWYVRYDTCRTNFLFTIFEDQKQSEPSNLLSKIFIVYKFPFLYIAFYVVRSKRLKLPEKSAVGFYLPEKGKADADLSKTSISKRRVELLKTRLIMARSDTVASSGALHSLRSAKMIGRPFLQSRYCTYCKYRYCTLLYVGYILYDTGP